MLMKVVLQTRLYALVNVRWFSKTQFYYDPFQCEIISEVIRYTNQEFITSVINARSEFELITEKL